MEEKFGYWQQWLIGGKIILTGIIPSIVAIIGVALVNWARTAGQFVAIAALISVLLFVFIQIWMLGALAHEFWKWK